MTAPTPQHSETTSPLLEKLQEALTSRQCKTGRLFDQHLTPAEQDAIADTAAGGRISLTEIRRLVGSETGVKFKETGFNEHVRKVCCCE